MTSGITRDRLLLKLRGERNYFESVLERVPYRRRNEAGAAGEWSLRELLLHLWSYEQFLADRLQETANGEEYTPSQAPAELEQFLLKNGYPDFGSPLMDDDQPNAWVLDHYQDLELVEVVPLEAQAFEQIVNLVEAAPLAELEARGLDEWLAADTWEHYNEHLVDLQTWLAEQGL